MNKNRSFFLDFTLIMMLFIIPVASMNAQSEPKYPKDYDMLAVKVFDVVSDNNHSPRPHNLQGAEVNGNILAVTFGCLASDSLSDDYVQIKKYDMRTKKQVGTAKTFSKGKLGHGNDVAYPPGDMLYVATMTSHLRTVCITAACAKGGWQVGTLNLTEPGDPVKKTKESYNKYSVNQIAWCGSMGTGRFAISDGVHIRFYRKDGYRDPWPAIPVPQYGIGQGISCIDTQIFIIRSPGNGPDGHLDKNTLYRVDWRNGAKLGYHTIYGTDAEAESVFYYNGYAHLATNDKSSPKGTIYRLIKK